MYTNNYSVRRRQPVCALRFLKRNGISPFLPYLNISHWPVVSYLRKTIAFKRDDNRKKTMNTAMQCHNFTRNILLPATRESSDKPTVSPDPSLPIDIKNNIYPYWIAACYPVIHFVRTLPKVRVTLHEI